MKRTELQKAASAAVAIAVQATKKACDGVVNTEVVTSLATLILS